MEKVTVYKLPQEVLRALTAPSHIMPPPPRRHGRTDEGEGEAFNFDSVDQLSDDSQPRPAPAREPRTRTAPRPHAATAAATVEMTTPEETTVVASIMKPVLRSNRAPDIDLIFDRARGKKSVCRYCR